MYLGFYNFYDVYNRNRMFEDGSSAIGDDLLYPMVHLGKHLRGLGHRVATIDMDDPAKFDRVLFFDYPTRWNALFRRLVAMRHPGLHLACLESPMLRPDNYRPTNHRAFRKVFTWHTGLADGGKYVHLPMANKVADDPAAFDPALKDRFCTVIAGHKRHPGTVELYSERVRAIRWFERNHPEEFDLYGIGWDRALFPAALYPLNYGLGWLYRRFPGLPRANAFPSYRGTLKRKKETLRRYKFSIAYENASYPGYISEKLIDCLMAGSVPVYLGAPDVRRFVPEDCFIDKGKFRSYDELYGYMKGMGDAEHRSYLEAARRFVGGQAIRPFSAEGFAETLARELLD